VVTICERAWHHGVSILSPALSLNLKHRYLQVMAHALDWSMPNRFAFLVIHLGLSLFFAVPTAFSASEGIVLEGGIAQQLPDGTWMLGEYRAESPVRVSLAQGARLISCQWQGKVCGAQPWILALKGKVPQEQRQRKLVVVYSVAGKKVRFELDALTPNFPDMRLVGKSVLNQSLVFGVSVFGKKEHKGCHLFVLSPKGQLEFYRLLNFPCVDFRPHMTKDGLFYSYQEIHDGIPMVAFLGPRVVLDAQFRLVRRIEVESDGAVFILRGADHWIGLELDHGTLASGMPYFNKRLRERKNGVVVYDWGASDYFLDRGSEAVTEAVIANDKGRAVAQILHINALQVLSDNEWIVSFGNSVGLLDKKSRKLRWILGGLSDQFALTPTQAASFLNTPFFDVAKSELYVFANRPTSVRILRYHLDVQNRTIKDFKVLRDKKELTHLMGSLQVQDDVLSIGFGSKERATYDFIEVQGDHTSWRLKLPNPQHVVYRFYRSPI
jgi:hypothetical protein